MFVEPRLGGEEGVGVGLDDGFEVGEHLLHDTRIPHFNHLCLAQADQTGAHHHPQGLKRHFVCVGVLNDLVAERTQEDEGFQVGEGEERETSSVQL